MYGEEIILCGFFVFMYVPASIKRKGKCVSYKIVMGKPLSQHDLYMGQSDNCQAPQIKQLTETGATHVHTYTRIAARATTQKVKGITHSHGGTLKQPSGKYDS